MTVRYTLNRPSDSSISILQSTHMTATVTTESGSGYTVVARPKTGVVLIHDDKGWVCQGAQLRVVDGRMYLANKEGQILASTTRLTRIYIATN